MNKFLILFTFCIILAAVSCSITFDVKRIDGQDDLKVNLKFTIIGKKNGRSQTVKYDNLKLKVGTFDLDFNSEFSPSPDDTMTVQYELAESANSTTKPAIRFGLCSLPLSIYGGVYFCPVDHKNLVAPGETIELKEQDMCVIRAD